MKGENKEDKRVRGCSKKAEENGGKGRFQATLQDETILVHHQTTVHSTEMKQTH